MRLEAGEWSLGMRLVANSSPSPVCLFNLVLAYPLVSSSPSQLVSPLLSCSLPHSLEEGSLLRLAGLSAGVGGCVNV